MADWRALLPDADLWAPELGAIIIGVQIRRSNTLTPSSRILVQSLYKINLIKKCAAGTLHEATEKQNGDSTSSRDQLILNLGIGAG